MAIEVRCIEHLSSEQRQSLNLLYGPLMGKNSICLYEFLGSIQNLVELEDVYLLLNMNASQFDIARNRLEQYHLIETYVHEGDMLILLYAPLLPDSFLCHETYSRLYLASVGAKCFDKVKAMLYKDKTVSSSYTKVESPLDVSILDSWNESKEIAFEKVKPTIKQKYDFDFATLFKGMDRIFPVRLRTSKNLDRIAEMAKIYGIDAKDMRKYVQRSTNPSTHVFDLEKLKDMVMRNRKVMEVNKDPYKMSPVKFLQNKQNGIPVVKSDQALIERLCKEFQFPIEVVNTLIEYTLQQTNQQFSRNYVEKVAASWVRLGVDSRKKALDIINQSPLENKRDKKAEKVVLDDKFYTQKEEKSDAQLHKEMLELQKMLKEGKL
ncbi:DnaD domain protein [Holdemanella biformis]|uniref:Replication initiation and membrane attachment protein, DnaB/DnaD family n=1 Tax=Holdemanella biformis DSM 3989 TaxID=518637 RepID=B7C9U4_9FIRM|nr:DnaD domain protein [Holdemanella biformis]EEC90457.1 replication initiation and membrane attachment protein, DnaB/DnaD family [Holdemanella biformis DSM 3989]MCC3355135.1 DnaD domain protein [Holdemanella biformis]